MSLNSKVIIEKAKAFGTDFIGFTSASRFFEYRNQKEIFQSDPEDPPMFYNWINTIIILGVPLLLPVLETCPSAWGLDQEHILTNILEKSADRIVDLITANNEKAAIYPLEERSLAVAGYVAGLGAIGDNGRLLTSDYGPRVRLKAVATSFSGEIAPTVEPVDANNCLHCGNCKKICPVSALNTPGEFFHCAEFEESLTADFRNPCAACLKVCPVGADRILYESNDFSKYFNEREILERNPDAPEYKGWTHVRSYGSYPIKAVKE